MIKASIIITTHNRPQLRPRAVESARAAGTDVEIVVVDDASTDETAEVCKSLAGVNYVRVVEAMACGKPIIASDVGGIPDMIGDESGILVPPGDVSALAEAMLRLAKDTDLRRTMGQAARQRYQNLFSPNVVVPLMLETYHRVTQNGHYVVETGNGNGRVHPWASISK